MGADHRVVTAIEASLAAVLTASVFLSEQYYLPLWFLVAAACGLEISQRKRIGH